MTRATEGGIMYFPNFREPIKTFTSLHAAYTADMPYPRPRKRKGRHKSIKQHTLKEIKAIIWQRRKAGKTISILA
jgi:hypothetical protein